MICMEAILMTSYSDYEIDWSISKVLMGSKFSFKYEP